MTKPGLTRPSPPLLPLPRPEWQALLPAAPHSAEECRARNDRQSYIALVRELDHASGELARRLWDDARERHMDFGRIVHLLCLCSLSSDEASLQAADAEYLDALADHR